MASGSYRDQSTNSPPASTNPTPPSRKRATLKIADLPPVPASRERETGEDAEIRVPRMPKSQRSTSRNTGEDAVLPVERAPKSQRSTSRAVTALQDPAITEPPRRYQGTPPQPDPLARHRSLLSRLVLTVICVVIGALVLTIAGVYMRQPISMVNYSAQSFPIQLGGSYQAFNTWNNSTGPIPTQTPLPKNPGPYSVLGKPTVSAALINKVLASYNSPTKGMGQSLYNLGVQYGIDPVYAMAFFMHESLFGTTGEARATLSLGNERCIPDRSCIDQNRGGYAKMNSWQDGFEHWYKLIRNLYVAQWGLVTVDKIIPRYAPNSDGNNEKEYIASLKHEIDIWRAGGIKV